MANAKHANAPSVMMRRRDESGRDVNFLCTLPNPLFDETAYAGDTACR